MSDGTITSNPPSFGVIIMVSLAVTLSALALLMQIDPLIQHAKVHNETAAKREVYKNLVPINARLQDANSVVVLVELNYDHADYEIMHVKELVGEAASHFSSLQTSLIEEEIRKSPRVKNAWVYFKHLSIRAE